MVLNKHNYLIKKAYFFTAVLLLFFVLANNPANGQDFKFSHLTVDDGLSHTDTKDIKQDKSGFIWIATLFGLDRYDGYSFKTYYNRSDVKNSAFKNRIESIFPDDDGRVWMATHGGIECFDAKNQSFLLLSNPEHIINNDGFNNIMTLNHDELFSLRENKPYLFKINKAQLTQVKLKWPDDIFFFAATKDNQGNIWLTSDNSIWVLKKDHKFKRAILLKKTPVPTDPISKLYFNNQGDILFAKGHSIAIIKQNKVSEIVNSKNAISPGIYKETLIPPLYDIVDLVQDQQGNYLVSSYFGLILLNADLKLLKIFTALPYSNGLISNHFNKMLIDRSKCLWLCTFGSGLYYCDLDAKPFHTIKHNPEMLNTLSGDHVRAVVEDSGHEVWIGTNDNGLDLYDFNTDKFSVYSAESSPIRIKSNTVFSLTLDKELNLWIGTSNGIDILNRPRTALKTPLKSNVFPAQQIEALATDYYGNIWYGSRSDGSGCIINDKKHEYAIKHYGQANFIFADQNRPEILISSTSGLKRLIIDSLGNILKSYQYTTNNQSNSLSSDYTYPIRKQNDSTYWIGTLGGGLDRLLLKKNGSYNMKIYGSEYGIFYDVESLEIDDKGSLWLGGNGLEKFNPLNNSLIKYNKLDGLQGNSFKVGASTKGNDGRLYFGGINGLNYFYPDSIRLNTIVVTPVLTDIIINNKPALIGEDVNKDHQHIHQAIEFSGKVNLDYLQNNFVVYFSAMDFANPFKCRYKYKLIGFDDNWRYTDGKSPSAAYSNLDYGSYTFIVEATNNDGLWSKKNAHIVFLISPPWWKSTVAKVIYFLLLLSGLIAIYIYQARWYRLKRQIAIKDIEESKREEMHLQQLEFFANIVHELRTPVTLILGPLEDLIKQNKLLTFNQSLQMISRNAKRLLNLINELMNFRKVDDNAIKLKTKPIFLNEFIANMHVEFHELALNKDIEFSLTVLENDLPIWFDLQIVEKILFNLLNNAFKYTEPGGKVDFEVFFDFEKHKPFYRTEFSLKYTSRASKYVYFRIADTGVGISQDSIKHIFERYYRIGNDHLGSGVGLALVKSLTQIHKGDIYVFSERNEGTEFLIALPCGENDFEGFEKEGVHEENDSVQLEKIENIPFYQSFEADIAMEISHASKKLILLVEDNIELRLFLKSKLEREYNVLEAGDGMQGVELATDKMPELIISDVMMPKMDGVAFCKKIKEQFETSHIPFLILSAKNTLNNQIQGIESGADYYFAKPISIEFLLLTVRNILEQKKKLKAKYATDYYAEATELVHSAKDKAFIEKLVNLIDSNIQKTELDVDFLCKNLNVSRTKLYQKINSITGQSIGDFIRTARLKKAAYIMSHEDVTMNELVDRIGLQSSSYFAKAFKKEFGMLPSHFLQSFKAKPPQ